MDNTVEKKEVKEEDKKLILKKRKKLSEMKKQMLADIYVPVEKISEYTFCFYGEFGFEMITWVPFVKFISEKYNVKVKTCSFPGSSVYYYFSDHTEVSLEDPKVCQGFMQNYLNVSKKLGIKVNKLIFPCLDHKKRRIVVGNCEFNMWNLLGERLPLNFHSKLDFSHVDKELPFETDRPVVTINNKGYTQNFHDTMAHNFFNRWEVIKLRDYLIGKGFFVAYNQFRTVGLNDTEVDCNLNMEDIFGLDDNSYDMNDYYQQLDINEINLNQLNLFNHSEFVIGVQGGGIAMPAACRKDLFAIQRVGDTLDYGNLERMYGVKSKSFYEVDHLLTYLDSCYLKSPSE